MTTNKAFLGINLDLINNPQYENVSFLAKALYALYSDRASCSSHSTVNGDRRFVDKDGLFIFYSNEEVGRILGVTARTVTNLRKELIGNDLIKVKRNGLTGYKIYVKTVVPTPESVEWKMPWKKFDDNSNDGEAVIKSAIQDAAENNSYVKEKSSDTTRKNESLSVSHSSVSQRDITNETSVTSETSETGMNEQSSAADSLKTTEDIALEGLQDRVSSVVGVRAWGKINMIAQGSYDKAKQLVDTIYKAKKQVMSRVRNTILREFYSVPEIHDIAWDSMHFEKNNLLASSLESALIRIVEISYKGQSVIKNQDAFEFTFIRNALASSVNMFLEDNIGDRLSNDMRSYVHKSLMF